jgi:predicted thioesterase
MEKAGREAIETLLPAEKMTVGIWIRVKHFAATPLGMKVRAEANLKEVNRRRLVFETAVFDEIEKVAEGENVQIIVSKDRFLERIQKKKQMLNTN